MWKNVLAGLVLMLLAMGCAAQPDQGSGETWDVGEMCVYELTFEIGSMTEAHLENVDVVLVCCGEEIDSGHRLRYPAGVFSFRTIEVYVRSPGASCKTELHVGLCDGGVGRTEVTLAGENGEEVVFPISCRVSLLKFECPPTFVGGHFVRNVQNKPERKFQKLANCTG